MANITAQMVKELRQATGAGVMDCKEALTLHEGDFEKATAYLREKGLAAAARRAEREAREGMIGTYIHPGSRVAGMVELNCETDFVARTEEFQQLAHDLAMQVVAAKPLYLSKEDAPAEIVVEDELLTGQRREKYLEENCLLEKSFIKDPSVTIGDLVRQKNALMGENLIVRRFVRYEVGG